MFVSDFCSVPKFEFSMCFFMIKFQLVHFWQKSHTKNLVSFVSVSQAAIQNPDWAAYTAESYFLTVVEAGSPRSRCWQVHFLLQPLRGFSLCPQGFSHCEHVSGFSLLYVHISSSCKDISQIGSVAHLEPHFRLIASLKALSPNAVTF